MPKASPRRAHRQAFLNLPDASRYRVHDGHLQIALQSLDDVESAPAGTQHIDGVSSLRPEEAALDMGVDLLARQFLDLVERHVDTFHRTHGEACVTEISGEDRIELGRKICCSNHGLHMQVVSAFTWVCATVIIGVLYFLSHRLTISASRLRPWTMKGGAPWG